MPDPSSQLPDLIADFQNPDPRSQTPDLRVREIVAGQSSHSGSEANVDDKDSSGSQASQAPRTLTGVRVCIIHPGAAVSYDSGVMLFNRRSMKTLHSLTGQTQ